MEWVIVYGFYGDKMLITVDLAFCLSTFRPRLSKLPLGFKLRRHPKADYLYTGFFVEAGGSDCVLHAVLLGLDGNF